MVTRDGLPLVSELPASVNTETFAAMTATMMGAADTAASQVTDQTARRIEVRYEGWLLCTYGAGPDVILVVLARDDVDAEALDKAALDLADEIRAVF